mmetsp:Transcript_16660/g.35272  ORF Transcript_16660/g.35272 Transcript_16660/m.35272 type:complete len:164 (+) Transcript_16660:318-809(+)
MQIAWYQIPESLDQAFYAFEAVVSAVLVTNILQFGWWRCKGRTGSLTHWQRWDAAYWLLAAVPLNLCFPFAVVMIYIGKVGYPGSKMWTSGWWPNTPHGVILYIFKFLGVIVLTVGVFKATQLHRRIAAKWRQLRRRSAAVVEGDDTEGAKATAQMGTLVENL